MTEQNLSDLLDRAGDNIHVRPAPLDLMIARVRRRQRRRRTLIAAATGAAVLVTVVGTAMLNPPGSGRPDQNDPIAATEPVPLPAGMRWVGLGHVAVAVPQEWGTNESECGTPTRDTVLVNLPSTGYCFMHRPPNVESVEVVQGLPRTDFVVTETIEIDGVPAQLQARGCWADPQGVVRTCAATVHLPSPGIWLRIESSTSAAEVDQLLERIHILPERVGVPAFEPLIHRFLSDSAAEYIKLLDQAGLAHEIVTKPVRDRPPGLIVDVSPSPGTMLAPGETVQVTITGEADSADDASELVKARWANRDALASCGDVRVAKFGSREQTTKEGLACLSVALDSGQGAELKVTRPTVEGDPITTYYRITPDETFEVYTDSTEDKFGSQGWSYTNCGRRDSLPDLRC